MQAINALGTFNVTSNFVPLGGGDFWENISLPIKESVAYAQGTAMAYEVSASATTGKLIAMPATNANGQNFVGILQEKVSATDADYATAFKRKVVAIPRFSYSRAKFTAGTTLTAANVGRVVQFASSGTTLANTTNGLGAVIRDIIDTTNGIGICSFDVPLAVTA